MEGRKPWITRPPEQNEAPQSGLRPGHPFGVPPIKSAPPPHKWMACGHAFLKRGTCRAVGHHYPDQNRHLCGTKAMKTNSQDRKATPAGLWPGKQRTKGGTCRPWLIYGRGKAWSKRPNRQAGRHGRKRPPLRGAKTGTNHARPTSRPPAQPGACARHAGKVSADRKTEKPVYQEGGAASPQETGFSDAQRPQDALLRAKA